MSRLNAFSIAQHVSDLPTVEHLLTLFPITSMAFAPDENYAKSMPCVHCCCRIGAAVGAARQAAAATPARCGCCFTFWQQRSKATMAAPCGSLP